MECSIIEPEVMECSIIEPEVKQLVIEVPNEKWEAEASYFLANPGDKMAW
jgi:hypothetical protein